MDNLEGTRTVKAIGPMAALTALTAVVILAGTLLLHLQYTGFGAGTVEFESGPTLDVAVAAYDRVRQQGLSGRSSLEPHDGMLFLFPRAQRYAFWMQDMRFPIDVVWIRAGEVVDLTYGLSIPEGDEEPLTFAPVTPADAVLEVPAGFIAEHDLRVGQPVSAQVDRRGRLR
ncbi:DUF192 domain-containing protein [Patescibacteria group bacterium]